MRCYREEGGVTDSRRLAGRMLLVVLKGKESSREGAVCLDCLRVSTTI